MVDKIIKNNEFDFTLYHKKPTCTPNTRTLDTWGLDFVTFGNGIFANPYTLHWVAQLG